MSSFLQHVRYAARQLRKNPGFTAVTVLTLGIGIGSSAAIFSLLDTFWLRPMAIPQQQQIVRLFSTTQQEQQGFFSYGEYQAMAHSTQSLKSLVAIGRRGTSIPRPDGTLESREVDVVSGNFFDALGVKPLLGRVFTSSDRQLIQNTPVVVLGHSFWLHHFNGDPSVVGHTITLVRGDNKLPALILGVLPPSFREIDNGSDRDLWMPTETWYMIAGPKESRAWDFRWFNLLGRLAPGAGVTEAQNELRSVARSFELSHPESNRNRSIGVVSDLHYRLQNAGIHRCTALSCRRSSGGALRRERRQPAAFPRTGTRQRRSHSRCTGRNAQARCSRNRSSRICCSPSWRWRPASALIWQSPLACHSFCRAC